MLFSLQEKTALVTGGGTGIGLAITEAFLEFGARVYISARRPTPLNDAVQRLSASYPGMIEGFVCDNKNPQDIAELGSKIRTLDHGLDILVNNAGVQHRGLLEDMPSDRITDMFLTNVKGMFDVSREMLPLLKIRGGKIINISSFVAETARTEVGAYAATKGAMRQFTKSMAVEWAKYGIQVNAIMPGTIVTGFNPKQYDPDWCSQAVKGVPAKRLGVAADVAGTAVYLASKASDYVTGVSIAVDGGILAGI